MAEVIDPSEALIGRLVHDDEGGERYTFLPGTDGVLARALDALEAAGDDAWPALEALLRLTVALDGELESRGAAELVRRGLRASPFAAATIARHTHGSHGIDRARAFLASEGRSERLAPPRPASGGVSARDFMNPHWQDVARARAR
jgi:hypothetical protein